MNRGDGFKAVLSGLMKLAATIVVTLFIVEQAGLSSEELRRLDMGPFGIRAGWLAASCLILLSGFFSTALIWSLIVRDLGGISLSRTDAITVFMIGNLGRYVPGKIWQIAALGALARERGVSVTSATAAAVLGQGAGLAAAMLIGLGAVSSLAADNLLLWVILGAVLTGTLLGLSPLIFNRICRLWFRIAKADLSETLTNRDGARWVLLSLGSWCIYSGAFWAFSVGLGFDLELISSASAFAAAYVLGYLAFFAPAGLGIREGILITLLSSSVGIAPATALAAAARLWITIVELIPAGSFWIRHLIANGGIDDRE